MRPPLAFCTELHLRDASIQQRYDAIFFISTIASAVLAILAVCWNAMQRMAENGRGTAKSGNSNGR